MTDNYHAARQILRDTMTVKLSYENIISEALENRTSRKVVKRAIRADKLRREVSEVGSRSGMISN